MMILIVEDNVALAETLGVALSLIAGADVVVVHDGAEGRRLLASADALCTDLDLPRVHGSVLVAEFRKLKPGAPVIAMSAGPPGVDLGADRFFPKPYSTAVVRETLKELLHG